MKVPTAPAPMIHTRGSELAMPWTMAASLPAP